MPAQLKSPIDVEKTKQCSWGQFVEQLAYVWKTMPVLNNYMTFPKKKQ